MKHQKGFTLVEVIIMVAVLSTVLTMAMPDMNRLFIKQNEMTESLRLKQLAKALKIFSIQNKMLPAEATWVDDLAAYTELSKDQIDKDVWGTSRNYKRFTATDSYLGGSYTIYFATISSNGSNNTANVVLPGNKASFSTFEYKTKTSVSGNDDLAIKFTDQSNKIKLVEETLNRMEKLSYALEKYARVKQIHAITNDPENTDSFIYFPSAKVVGDPGVYYRKGAAGGVEEIDTAKSAVALANKLGLPSEYGQDALTDNNMWYISNPNPANANYCSGARSQAPFYPPVIVVGADPC